MQGGFRSSYQRESGQESQRSRMGKDAENSQKVFLRWALEELVSLERHRFEKAVLFYFKICQSLVLGVRPLGAV
jgi:hypothetical protein